MLGRFNMKKYILPLILILLLTFTLIGDCTWLSGWDYRIELAIGDYVGDIGAEVVWFPVTIHLKDANGDSTKVFEEIGNNYRKTAITKADGTTELKGEIEGWNYDAGTPANSTGFIHTSVDGWTINANTSIYLYYDNGHADNANIDIINTAAGAAVWDGNFDAVYHMVDATTSTVSDSTSNNNDGTKKGVNLPVEVTGKVGLGQDFTTDWIYNETFWDVMPDDVSIEAVIKYVISASEVIFTKFNISGEDRITLRIAGTSNLVHLWGEASDAGIKAVFSTDALSNNIWYYVAGVHTHDAALKVYLNTAEDTGETLGSIGDGTDLSAFIGVANDGGTEQFAGIIDELRLSNIARSVAWLKGTYNSLWDSLLTYGSEETSIVGITWNDITITKWNTKTITTPINTQ